MLLKAHFDSGYFCQKNYLKAVSLQLSCHKTTVRSRFQSMIKNGLITPIYNKQNKIAGYQLISYDNLWQRLGFTPKRGNKGGYINCKEIIKIPRSEVKNNKSKLLDIIYHFDQCRLEQRIKYVKKKDNQPCRVELEGGCQISQHTLANLFGLNTRMAVSKFHKRLRERGFLETKSNYSFVESCHIYSYLKNDYKRNNSYTFYQKNDDDKRYIKIYQRSANTLKTKPLSFFNPDHKLKPIIKCNQTS